MLLIKPLIFAHLYKRFAYSVMILTCTPILCVKCLQKKNTKKNLIGPHWMLIFVTRVTIKRKQTTLLVGNILSLVGIVEMRGITCTMSILKRNWCSEIIY